MTTEQTPREKVLACAKSLGLDMVATFVPWSQSRSFKKDAKITDRNINWKIKLRTLSPIDGQEHIILETDYSAGIGHIPGYTFKSRMTVYESEQIESATETGRAIGPAGTKGAAIRPDTADVLYSLAADSDVLDYGTFEEWADSFGYDPDSRKAETIYRACLEIALKLRNGIGEAGLSALREACQDF